MENKNMVSPSPDLPCESAPVLKKLETDRWDKVFAVVYVFLGYAFLELFQPGMFGIRMSGFTVLYVVVVWVYCYLKGMAVTRENVFWTAIVVSIGLPYGFYSIMPFWQLCMLFVAAAYWTLAVSGGLLKEKRTSSWVLVDIWNGLLALPILNFLCHIRTIMQILRPRSGGKQGRMILFGLVLSLPVLCIIVPVLSRADQGFYHMVQSVFSFMDGGMFSFLFRTAASFLVGALMFGTAFGGFYRRHIQDNLCRDWKDESGENFHMIPDTAVYTFALVICLVYLLFTGLQGRYLFSAFLGILPKIFTYAEYARQGFFELCGIAAFNGVLLLFMNFFSRTLRKENKILQRLNSCLAGLTILLILTAMSKMGMYIAAYGWTVKRILSSVFMIWMFLVYSMVIVLQKKEIPLIRWSVFAGAVLFSALCVLPIERWIWQA